MARIISITNNKGGVGKTTTTLNLAYALARHNKKVLLIDLDPQSSLTIYVGIEPLELEYSTYDVITDKCMIKEAILETNNSLINILPATIDLSAAEVEIVSKIGREFILKDKLQEIKDFYDYIIIDNSPSLGILTINSLMASRYVISPSEATYLSLRGLEILFSTLSEVKRLNKDLDFMGVIVTLFDSRTTHHKEVLEMIQNTYPTFDTIIKRSIKFSDSCLAAQSVFEFSGEEFEGTRAYIELAKEVIYYEQKS